MPKNIYFISGAIIIAGIIIAGAVIYVKAPQTVDISENFKPEQKTEERINSKVELTVAESDHIRGNPAAPITIIEFSDFQCPFCLKFHPTMKQILENYPDQVRWVYRHFPLDSIHSEARPSAEASECAAEQGKFWEFTDGLFDNQSELGPTLYKELARNLGLDLVQFDDCVFSRRYKDRVEADLQEGIKAGVKGTPGSFINGEEIPGAVPYEYLKAAVEKALE